MTITETVRVTKRSLLITLIRRPDGACVDELAAAVGRQAHSVRGVVSGALRKKLSLAILAATEEGRGRVYRLRADA